MPMKMPHLFTGLRAPTKGVLLFGPPGTGKTLIGKGIGSQCSATFFSISASSLMSKWIGESEQLVRALFAVARSMCPAVIFIDEVDSLLSQRSSSENEATRRVKTEFLVQLDGAGTAEAQAKNVLVVGATNRPQELDEAARRRFVKRLHIPLPDEQGRTVIIETAVKSHRHGLAPEDISFIVESTSHFSGADMHCLCKEAAMGPIRDVHLCENMNESDLPPITRPHFEAALRAVKASVSEKDLEQYRLWDEEFGST